MIWLASLSKWNKRKSNISKSVRLWTMLSNGASLEHRIQKHKCSYRKLSTWSGLSLKRSYLDTIGKVRSWQRKSRMSRRRWRLFSTAYAIWWRCRRVIDLIRCACQCCSYFKINSIVFKSTDAEHHQWHMFSVHIRSLSNCFHKDEIVFELSMVNSTRFFIVRLGHPYSSLARVLRRLFLSKQTIIYRSIRSNSSIRHAQEFAQPAGRLFDSSLKVYQWWSRQVWCRILARDFNWDK